MSITLPPLPEPLPAREWLHDMYTADQLLADRLAVARAVREACAAVCESRQLPGTGSVAILNGAADAIRALKIEGKNDK